VRRRGSRLGQGVGGNERRMIGEPSRWAGVRSVTAIWRSFVQLGLARRLRKRTHNSRGLVHWLAGPGGLTPTRARVIRAAVEPALAALAIGLGG
jgi:hypothetical protein